VKRFIRSARSLLRAWLGRVDGRGKQPPPCLEPLEDRWVPAAMTFKVTNSLDEVNGGDNSLSLREAIIAANANAGVDTIVFKQSLNGADIQLTMGEIPITESVIIKGLGKNNLTVHGGEGARIFHITNGGEGTANINTTISGIRMSDGGPSDSGGAILQDSNISGLLKIQSCILSHNTAGGEGGAIDMMNGDLTIQNSELTNNTSGAEGGAIHFLDGTMQLTGDTFRKNHADQQAGVMDVNGQVTIEQCTFDRNTSGDEGGAIDFGEERGGALTMRNSTLSRNEASTQGGSLFFGGGEGAIRNCTISSNKSGTEGGGVFIERGNLTLTNTTVTQNNAETQPVSLRIKPLDGAASGGGGIFINVGTLRLENTIVAGNKSGGSPNDLGSNDAVINALFSLIQNGKSSVNGINQNNIFGVSPLLGPLQDNGGPTETHLPQTGSPAINNGSNDLATAAGLTTDQRIFQPRILGGTVDIGSVEVGGGAIRHYSLSS